MGALEQARALYNEVASSADGSSVEHLGQELKQRAREVREGKRAAVRGKVAETLGKVEPEETKEVGHQLEEAAEDVQEVFGSAAPTFHKLAGDTAAEAQLESSVMRVDPRKIRARIGRLVDKAIAADIRDHEHEHNFQSAYADTQIITIGKRRWEVPKVREAAAISVQQRVDFLSDEYCTIAQQLTMDAADRTLVRQGRFKALEAKKNGIALAA